MVFDALSVMIRDDAPTPISVWTLLMDGMVSDISHVRCDSRPPRKYGSFHGILPAGQALAGVKDMHGWGEEVLVLITSHIRVKAMHVCPAKVRMRIIRESARDGWFLSGSHDVRRPLVRGSSFGFDHVEQWHSFGYDHQVVKMHAH